MENLHLKPDRMGNKYKKSVKPTPKPRKKQSRRKTKRAKLTRIICLTVLIMMCVGFLPVFADTDVKTSTAIANIEKYDAILTEVEQRFITDLEFKERTYELSLLNSFMLLSGYTYAYNQTISSSNSTATGDTTTETTSYDGIFKDHLGKINTKLTQKNDYVKENFKDRTGDYYAKAFTNDALDVYVNTIDTSKASPESHAKLLAEALVVESDNRLRLFLKEISDAGDDNGKNVLLVNKAEIVATMDIYKEIFNNSKTLYGLGITTFSSTKLDEYNRAYIEMYNAFDAIAKKYGVSLTTSTLTSEDIVNVNASDLIDLVAAIKEGSPKKLSKAYLSLFADSAVFMPYITKVNSMNNTEYLDQTTLEKLHRVFGNRRKPLYLMEVDNQVEDYVKNGGTPNKSRVANLQDLIYSTEDIDIALFLKRDSEASSIQALGLEGNAELSEEQREKIEDYRITGISKDFTKAVYVASAQAGSNETYMKANTNYLLLNNSTVNYKSSKEVTADVNSPIYMDIYGNIVTETGYVVVPAVTNATFYKEAMLPLNASIFLNYPVFSNNGSSLSGQRAEDSGKLVITTPEIGNATDVNADLTLESPLPANFYKSADGTVDYTKFNSQAMLDISTNLNSKHWWQKHGATSSTGVSTAFIHPFTPYIWHRGVTDPYRVLDNPVADLDVFASGFNRWVARLGTAGVKMQLVPIQDKVIVSGDGAGYPLSNLLVSEQVQKAVYEQNLHYLTTDQLSAKPDGKEIGYGNGVLYDELLIDIAQEVARGSDIGNVLVGDLGKTELMADSIKSRGVWGVVTATIAGFGEDLHRLFHSGTKNIVTNIPNFTELPFMQTLVINVVPILSTALVVIFFVLIIVTYISRKSTTKELSIKLALISYVIFFVIVIVPTLITTFFNKVTSITNKNVIYSLLVEEENIDKGVATLAFDSFGGDDKLTTTSPDIIHANLSDEDIKLQLKAAGLSLTSSENKIQSYLFSDDRKFVSLDSTNTIYIRGDKLVTPVTSLYASSKISFKQESVPHPLANINVVTYKLYQDWVNDPKPHYFMPYYMVLDTLIYNSNTVASETYTIPLIKKYVAEDKTANIASTYFTSVLFTNPEVYNKLGIEFVGLRRLKDLGADATEDSKKGLEASMETARNARNKIGDSYDFLGLFNILQLPGRSVSAPFNDSNVDMEAVKRTSWASNYYVDKLNKTFKTHSANNSKPILIVNGFMTDDKNPALFTENEVYVSPVFLDTVGFSHSIKDNKLALWGNGIRMENVVGSSEYKVSIEEDGTVYNLTINGNATIVDSERVMLPITILEFFDGNVSVAKDRKSASVILRAFNKRGTYGEIIEKVYTINDKTRSFIGASKDYFVIVSDENLLKTISFYTSTLFANEFTHSSNKLSPIGISSGRVNYDTYIKSIYIPAKDLTNSDTTSLYYYIAYKYPSLLIFFILYQISLLVLSIVKTFTLYLIVVLFVFFALRYFLFKTKQDPVIFKGVFVALGYVYVSHIIIFVAFRASSVAINSGTDSFLSTFGATLLINILATLVSSLLLVFTLLAIKRNPSTLGAEKLTGWMKSTIDFFKTNVNLKNSLSKIHPNFISNKEKLEPNADINLNPNTANKEELHSKINKEEREEREETRERNKETYSQTSFGTVTNANIIENQELEEGVVSLDELGSTSLGTAKTVSIEDYNKELAVNPDLENKKFIRVGDRIVDVEKSLKSKGTEKNLTRIDTANTARLSNVLRSEGITHETHGNTIIALTNDKELSDINTKYNSIIEDDRYSKQELVKVSGDMQQSNIREILKDNNIKDYTTYDRSVILTKESANKVQDNLKKQGLKLENVTGLKAKDKESFKDLQKTLNKKVVLGNNIVYSPDIEDLASSTGKITVKNPYALEVNKKCMPSIEHFLKENNIDYSKKDKEITLSDKTLTNELVDTLNKSIGVSIKKVELKKGVNSVNSIVNPK